MKLDYRFEYLYYCVYYSVQSKLMYISHISNCLLYSPNIAHLNTVEQVNPCIYISDLWVVVLAAMVTSHVSLFTYVTKTKLKVKVT